MHQKWPKALLLFAFINMVIAAIAQQPLSLSQLIDKAKAQNRQIAIAKTDEKIAETQYAQTNAVYLPQVGLSATAFTTNNPLNAFGFKLQQQRIQQSDFNPALLNNPGATGNFLTQINVLQPIFNLDLSYLRKAAQKQTIIYQLATKRTEEYVVFEAKQAYLQLQLSKAFEKVMLQSLNTANALYHFTEKRFEQGFIQKPDLLNVAVQVKMLETKLQEARANINNATNQIKNLTNDTTVAFYMVDSLTQWSERALTATKRADFAALETAIDAYQLQIKSTQYGWLPRLNAFANYQFNDKNILGFGANAYLAGIQLSWDLFKGNQVKNKVQQQTLEKNKLQQTLTNNKANNQTEMAKIQQQLITAQFAINQQKLAVAQATEALQILENRYQQGLVNTTDVLMAQTQVSQTRLSMQQAIFEYNYALAYQEFLQP
jgi:outer membrane protein TolC